MSWRCIHGTPHNAPCTKCYQSRTGRSEPVGPSDNPCIDIMAALRRIEDKLDKLAPAAGKPDEFMTLREAAAYLSLSTSTLYRAKRLQIRKGRAIRFRRSELDRVFRSERFRAAS